MEQEKRDYARLLEEFERYDEMRGQVISEMLMFWSKLPPDERRRVERFIEEWLEGRHTLAEAVKLLAELKKRYEGNVSANISVVA